jgi:dihydroorotase
LKSGRLAKGAPADLMVVDLTTPWMVEPDQLRSKSKNTPFDGWTLKGAVAATIVGGEVRFASAAVAGLDELTRRP